MSRPWQPTRTRRPRHQLAVVALVAAAGLAAVLAGQGATAGFTGRLTGKGTYSTGSAILSDTVSGAATCSSSSTTVSGNATSCASNPLPTGTLPSTGTVAQTTTLSAPGTLMSSVAANNLACGVQDARDASSAGTNPGVARQTVTFGSAGPLGGTALAFTQSSNAYLSTVTPYTDPESFSIVTWFKFATGTSGSIIGFTDSPTDTGQANYDRHLWVVGGKLYWGVYPGAIQEVSSGALTAGTWHLAVANVGPTGQRLYVDGALVASNTAVTTAQVYTGWWHLGFSGATTWTNPPSNAYWPGSLADTAVIPTQVTAAQVSTLWAQSTNTAEQTAISALNPTVFWPMDDAGTGVYSGSLPGIVGSPFADVSSAGTNTGYTNGTITRTAAGPLSGGASTFDGSTGWVSTTTQYTNPHPLSISAWFKTSVKSGTIIEFADLQNGTSGFSTWDRHLWVDNTGHVVWGVYPNSVQEITSTNTYADGNWHLVVATVGPTYGMRLYVDGSLQASNTAVTAPQVFNGYWRIGYGNEQNGWTDPPTNAYWQGGLARVAVYPSELTPTQVASLSAPSTTTTFDSAVSTLAPSSYWLLTDTVTSSGTCALVDLTVQTTTGTTVVCALPAGSGSCPAPSTTATLGSWTTAALTGLTAGGSQSVVVTLARGTVPASATGVHVGGTMSFSATGAGFTAVIEHNYGPVTL